MSPVLDVANLKLSLMVFAEWLWHLMSVDDNGNPFESSQAPLLDTVCLYVESFKLGEDAEVENVLEPVLETWNY